MMSPEAQGQSLEQLLYKLDELHRALERLPEHFSALLLEHPPAHKNSHSSSPYFHSKDILLEGDFTTYKNDHHRTLSPEAQVQRLTAQLTAAYNRIADLEEQLLFKRNII